MNFTRKLTLQPALLMATLGSSGVDDRQRFDARIRAFSRARRGRLELFYGYLLIPLLYLQSAVGVSLELTASAEKLIEKFFLLDAPRDVADLLEVDYSRLIYHIYATPEEERYTTFDLPKRMGGSRQISAPATPLKILQRKLNQVLQNVYEPKAPVHSFVIGRSVVTNATMHVKQKYVLNVDLERFFPSVNFGRVRGMFMAIPYELPPEVATILAQVCCFDNELPQGAPTSPVISNMICAKVDSELRRLAQRHRCVYTRYADDITFSTSLATFPRAIATINDAGQTEVGVELKRIINENGFKVNGDKVRLQKETQRQTVTGLTVNEFPNVRRSYVRQIRAMLHAWRKFGLDAAATEFFDVYDEKHRGPYKEQPPFEYVVKGKIEFLGMVRGKDDRIYKKYCEQLNILARRDLGKNLFKFEEDDISEEDRDEYARYERGLRRLSEELKAYPDRYSDFLVYQQRLHENIQKSRRYGDTDNRKSDRSEIIDRLNALALLTLSTSYSEFCD